VPTYGSESKLVVRGRLVHCATPGLLRCWNMMSPQCLEDRIQLAQVLLPCQPPSLAGDRQPNNLRLSSPP